MAKTFNRSRFAAALRARRGDLSIRTAADEAGIAFGVLHDAERGHTEPSVGTLGKLCTWMDRDIWDFFDDEPAVVPVLID